ATPAQANTAWHRTVNQKLVICMEQQVEGISTMGAPVSVTNWQPLKLVGVPGRAVGYRVVANATRTKGKVPLYYDEILLSGSRTLTKLVFSSFRAPFSAAFETALAQNVSDRIG